VTRYRILSWRGIPAQLKVYGESGRPKSVELDGWFAKEIDRVAMREEIMGSDEYLALWEWSKDLERPGTVDEVVSEVVAEIEAEWRPGRGQAKEGTE
jgi:Virulence factor